MHCADPAEPFSAFFFDKPDNSAESRHFMDIKRPAHRFIVWYDFNMPSATHLTKMLDKFIGLHLETVDVGLLLCQAGLSDVDHSVFLFGKFEKSRSPRISVHVLFSGDVSDAHGQSSLFHWQCLAGRSTG